jgi:hypothetical protein
MARKKKDYDYSKIENLDFKNFFLIAISSTVSAVVSLILFDKARGGKMVVEIPLVFDALLITCIVLLVLAAFFEIIIKILKNFKGASIFVFGFIIGFGLIYSNSNPFGGFLLSPICVIGFKENKPKRITWKWFMKVLLEKR